MENHVRPFKAIFEEAAETLVKKDGDLLSQEHLNGVTIMHVADLYSYPGILLLNISDKTFQIFEKSFNSHKKNDLVISALGGTITFDDNSILNSISIKHPEIIICRGRNEKTRLILKLIDLFCDLSDREDFSIDFLKLKVS